MPDLSKLPLWARHHMQKLEADVTYWKNIATQVQTGTTRVTIDRLDDDRRMSLPDNFPFRFSIVTAKDFKGRDQHHAIDVSVNTDHSSQPALLLQSPTGRLVITPSSSNVAYVRVEL